LYPQCVVEDESDEGEGGEDISDWDGESHTVLAVMLQLA
jgi:hypothetical protein